MASRTGEIVEYEVIEYDGDLKGGTEARRYPDGSIRNDRGWMIEPLPGKHTITQADASMLALSRQEKRRALAREAANLAVERADYRAAYGDDAYFVEIVSAAQEKATNIDDPKMIDAARFVLSATGDIEKAEATGDSAGSLSVLAGLGAEVVKMLTAKAQEYNDA